MSIATTHITPEEYLERENASIVRHEYLNGEMREMPGGSSRHNAIIIRLIALLYSALRGTGYLLRAGDVRLKVSETGLYTYPDVCVATEEPEYEPNSVEILLNPALIIEVLSPSTEDYDRGDKFLHYQLMPAFREYLLIAQDKTLVEHRQRQADGTWISTSYEDPSDVIPLSSISFALPVARVYEDEK
jgi:Uma2 family endonuclease